MNEEYILLKMAGIDSQPKQIVINAYVINYIEYGQGPPLLLLHGLNFGWGQWYKNFLDLSKKHTVYAIDLPGSGWSSKVDFFNVNLERTFVDTVEMFIQKLNLKSTTIVAHSFGGWIAFKIALNKRNEIKKMLLINPMGFFRDMPMEYRLVASKSIANLLGKTVFRPSSDKIRKFLESSVADKSCIDDEFVDYLVAMIKEDQRSHPIHLISRLSGFFYIDEELDIGSLLAEIKIPLFIVIG